MVLTIPRTKLQTYKNTEYCLAGIPKEKDNKQAEDFTKQSILSGHQTSQLDLFPRTKLTKTKFADCFDTPDPRKIQEFCSEQDSNTAIGI